MYVCDIDKVHVDVKFAMYDCCVLMKYLLILKQPCAVNNKVS